MSYSVSVSNDKIVVEAKPIKHEVSLSRTGGQGAKGDSISNIYVNGDDDLIVEISNSAGDVVKNVNVGNIRTVINNGVKSIVFNNLTNGVNEHITITYNSSNDTYNFIVETSVPTAPETIVERDFEGGIYTYKAHFTSLTDKGALSWNDTDGTLDLELTSDSDTRGKVTLQLGQELNSYVLNKTGADISNGSVVRLSGSFNLKPTVQLASYTDEDSSTNTLGVATSDIPNEDFGYVTTFGLVRGVSFVSSFNTGDTIYLGLNGAITNIKPAAPNKTVILGMVLDPTTGLIFVQIDLGSHLDEAHDVDISNLSDGDMLVYDASAGYWTNQNPDNVYATDAELAAGLATKSNIGHTHALNDLSDVNISAAGPGFVIAYDSVFNRWNSQKIDLITLRDVYTTGLQNNDVLRYESSTKLFKPHTLTTTSLTDIDNTNKADGAVLVYNGTTNKYVSTKTIDNSNTAIIGGNF